MQRTQEYSLVRCFIPIVDCPHYGNVADVGYRARGFVSRLHITTNSRRFSTGDPADKRCNSLGLTAGRATGVHVK